MKSVGINIFEYIYLCKVENLACCCDMQISASRQSSDQDKLGICVLNKAHPNWPLLHIVLLNLMMKR